MSSPPVHFADILAHETPQFTRAVTAVVTADLEELRSCLAAQAELVSERSASPHRSTLLHYVASNGIEDELQLSKESVYQRLRSCKDEERSELRERAIGVARVLLAAGCEVDASCETYGGGPNQTTLNLLVSSGHPAAAGVQVDLVHVLLEAGAAVDGPDDGASPLMTALGFGYHAVVNALVANGARSDNLVTAAAAGRLELVRQYYAAAAPAATVDTGGWFPLANDLDTLAQQALVFASMCGRHEVMSFLIDQGVDPNAIPPGTHMTAGPLHTACVVGQVESVRRLLARGADPLKVERRYGGTPLSWAEHGQNAEVIAIVKQAIEASP